MGNYNPDLPYVVGMQWAPLVADQVLLDPATEVGYRFRSVTDWQEMQIGPDRVRVLVQPPPGQPAQKCVAVHLYVSGSEAATGPVRKLVIPCSSGAAVAGAGLGGGAGTVAAGVQNPSDAGHVTLTGPNAGARFWFAMSAAHAATLQYQRILDVSVRYAVSGPFDEVPAAMTVGLERPAANLTWWMDDTVTGPATARAGVAVRRAALGDLNPWWSPTLTPAATTMRLPFRAFGSPFAPTPTTGLDALAAAGGANIAVRFGTTPGVPAGAVFQLHYVALEVTFCEESRIAAGGLDISGGAVHADGGYHFDVPIREMGNFGHFVDLGIRGAVFAVTVTQAHAGALSLTSPVPVVLDRLGTLGQYTDHQGIVLRKTLREGSTPTMEVGTLMPAMVLIAPNNVVEAGSHPYTAQAVGNCHQQYAPSANAQVLADRAAGAYVWATFYARPTPGTAAPLTVEQIDLDDEWASIGPTGSISVADFDALPEAANGWKKVTVRLDPPVVLTGDGSPQRFGFSSLGDASAPWQVLGADTNPASQLTALANWASFDGEAGAARLDRQNDLSADLAISLARDMDPVTGLTLTSAVQDLAVVDADVCRPDAPVPTGIRFYRLRWDPINSPMVRGWGFFEVQRQDDTMPAQVWEVIARVREPQLTGVDDYEARVGVATRYRVRAVHRTGIGGPWTPAVTATIPVPGVTGRNVDTGVLIMTSNARPAANLAYVMSWDRRTPEDFSFPEAAQVDLQAMYGRDYRVAMRPVERGGIEFTRTVLVNAAAIPTATLDAGFRQLRDLVWESVPYVCVRDELEHRWLSTVLVPSASVRRRPGRAQLQVAQLTVIEVTDTPAPVDGGPAPCEGLRPQGAGSGDARAAITVDTMSVRAGTDGFDRQVPAGWGSTAMPARPWQLLQGAASALSVSGGAGQIRVIDVANSNPNFETGVAGWTAFGGTATHSTAQAHEGTGSLLLTPAGGTDTARVQSEHIVGAAVGVDWQATAWVRCPVARTVQLSINWFDAADTYLGTSNAAPVNVAANTWTRLTLTAASTFAGTVRAAVNVVLPGTPAVTHLLHVDEATIARAPGTTRLVTEPVLADVDVRASFRVDQTPTGAPVTAGLIARGVSSGDYYRANLVFRVDGQIAVSLDRIDAGVRTGLAAEQVQTTTDDAPLHYAPWQWITLRLRVIGHVLMAQAFTDTRPPENRVHAVDGTITAAGRIGVRAAGTAEITNPGTLTLMVDNLEVRAPTRDLDIQLLLRPTTEDPWSLWIEQLSLQDRTITARIKVQVTSLGMCASVGAPQEDFEACVSAEALELTPRQRRWLRCRYEQNIGGGQARFSFFTSLDGATWTLVGSETGPAVAAPIDPGVFLINAGEGVTLSRLYWRDDTDGRLLLSPQFDAQPPGTTAFVDAQGTRWEINGRGLCPTT